MCTHGSSNRRRTTTAAAAEDGGDVAGPAGRASRVVTQVAAPDRAPGVIAASNLEARRVRITIARLVLWGARHRRLIRRGGHAGDGDEEEAHQQRHAGGDGERLA